MGPIPLHMHQDAAHAALVGREGKPEGYYFPPQLNQTRNAFPFTFFGLAPGTSKKQIRDALSRWDQGDNEILNFSAAYRLQPGTGWLVGPGILHAPGSLCTYEPQWGSDVFGLFQNVVEGRTIDRELLVKDMPEEVASELEAIVDQLDWEANIDPNFKSNHYLEPQAVPGSNAQEYVDRRVVYGRLAGKLWFSARELTVEPLARCTLVDPGASSIVCGQRQGVINGQPFWSPAMIGFNELTHDEYFIPRPAVLKGLVIENHSVTEPLVILRYFGPEEDGEAPDIGVTAR